MGDLSQQHLREVFRYNDDGTFTILKSRFPVFVGTVKKSHPDSAGYLITWFNGKLRKFHRLVYLYHHGVLPKNIDHINQDKADNRIENLRAATTSQNMANVKKFCKTNEFKGVSLHKGRGRYIAHIRHMDKLIHLGYFETAREGAIAYDQKAIEIFGEFACLNFPDLVQHRTS